jgi:multidrug efflux pump subunit AcrA (membrane-fusion protein)
MNTFFRIHRRSILLVGAVLILSGGITAYLIAFTARPESTEEKKQVRLVEAVPLRYSPYTISIKGQGFISPSRSLVIAGRAGGRIVESIGNLKSGTAVEQGELLVRLDDEVIQNSLSLSRVVLIRSTAQLCSALKSEGGHLYEKWNAYLTRLNTGITPALPALESEREKLMTGTYGVLEAYYQVRELEDSLEDSRLYAPIAGHIDGDGVQLFSIVSPGEALLTLTDTRVLEISVPLTRDELLQLDTDSSSVAIRAAGREDAMLTGEIKRRDAVMRRDSQTVDVHVIFENPEQNPLFFPGNFAEVELSGRTLEKALPFPRALINGDDTVNVLESGELKKYPVRVLLYDGDTAVLAPTLPEGIRLITTRIQKPFEGMALRTEEEDIALGEEDKEISGGNAAAGGAESVPEEAVE